MHWLNRSFRLCFRLLWLSTELLLAALTYFLVVRFQRADRRMKARANWLQRTCRRLLPVLNVEVEASGPIPSAGLLVCNHLGYVDILVLGALTPAVFVAKREVKHWPVFGLFAALAGTVFVNRERRTQTGRAAEQIQAVLESGQLIVLFPEGTSSDGKTVLPFMSSLLQPATNRAQPLFAGALQYEIEDGDVGEEICYWRDMTFFPHLLNLLTKDHVFARLVLSPVDRTTTCRKTLARELHLVVSRLNAVELGLGKRRISSIKSPSTSSALFTGPSALALISRML